ncbi:MAG: C40 family peptidase [Gammaproteobacteria bacterium]
MGFSSGRFSRLSPVAALLLAVALGGCASEPSYPARQPSAQVGSKSHQHPGARIAAAQVGTPYRYGGATPRGFDCSGLVYYSYRKAGIRVPRTTSAQLRNAHRVPSNQLQPGDLVFFRLGRGPVSHVGIYTGNDRFIHAPSSGKRVSFTTMNDPYWQARFIAAGRYR